MKAMKKILTALLAVLMALALVSAAAAGVEFDGGNGLPASPYQIRTPEQLLEFASRVADGETGLCAVLTADITVADWTPIAIGRPALSYTSNSTTPYAGTFDGGGHTLTLTKKVLGTTADSSGVALFHTITKDGVVRNLNLDVDFRGYTYIGGVAARNYGTIERVTVEGTIVTGRISAAHTGGIAGWSGNTLVEGVYVPCRILYCVNKAEIYSDAEIIEGPLAGKTPYGSAAVGGIAGSFRGEMRYCANLGTIWINNTDSSSNTAGGASLFTIRTAVTPTVEKLIVSDCYNAGTVYYTSTSGSGNSGGLIAGYLAQVIGWNDNGGELAFSNIFNYGLIENPYLADSPGNVNFNIIGAVAGSDVSDPRTTVKKK